MAITRKFVSQNQEECQILKMDANQPFLVNKSKEWQFLLGPNSELTNSALQIKIAAQFNTETFDGLKIIAYLYEDTSGSVSSLGTCTFSVYKVESPTWKDTFILNSSGSILPNNYFYKEFTESDLGGLSLDGETTLMIEAVGIRLGRVYRNRIYVNHLGVYDSILRLRQDVEWLDLSKVDE